MYVDLGEVDPANKGAVRHTTVESAVAKANEILSPYTLDARNVPWYSVYEVGHRLTDKFDDVPAHAPTSQTPRVFITGDACHTHSAKAGQGMNVSMLSTAEFPAGFMTQYPPSILIGDAMHQKLATGFSVGKRFKSALVARVADGNPVHLGHHHRADGRWRVYVFADAMPGEDSVVPGWVSG